MSEKKKKNKPGQGRPKGTKRKEPTTSITYRVEKEVKKSAKEKYGRGLNKLHGDWLKGLIKEDEK